jgi:MFS transporter, MHS family, proline/betaine transporter
MVAYSDVGTGSTALQPSTKQIFLAATVSCLGWALDLYDLLILLYVAPIVGRLFFPPTNRCCLWQPSSPHSL